MYSKVSVAASSPRWNYGISRSSTNTRTRSSAYRGDLAVTVNSRAPSVNNGHIVRITTVIGPIPERNIEFGYEIERLDGQPFALMRHRRFDFPVPGERWAIAHQWQLRRLVESDPKASTDVRSTAPESILQTECG